MMDEFHGKKVLVTGASRGIGREIVSQLVKCSANVIAVSRNLAQLETLKKVYPSISIISVDLSKWDETKKALGGVQGVDCLVNNAGMTILENFFDVTENSIDKLFDLNVKSIINVSQIIAADMVRRNTGGSIVNVSSQASLAALQDHTVYCGTKGAVDSITRVMALELGKYNIRVNSINPTVILTNMGHLAWSDQDKAGPMLAKIPLGRFGTPDEVAHAVLFLLSSKSSMINGIALPIDGGFLAT